MLIHRIERLDFFLTNVLKTQKESKTSDLYFKKYNHVCLEKSSIKVSTYLALKKGVENEMRSL